ncbi:hypothetical protein [Streptomyces sp. NPDC029554]
MGGPFEGTAPVHRKAARLTAGAAFTLALVAWAALWVLRWRRGRT